MIRVNRDRIDSKKVQQELNDRRLERLPKLRKLIADGRQDTDEFRALLSGYKDITREHLWRSQHLKCCYCEKSDESGFNDVEHYRPKSVYWWLTFTWTNLLFACKACNRAEKNAQFLFSGAALQPEEAPNGSEVPLLLDPSDASRNPVEHIQFIWKPYLQRGPNRWVAEERNGCQYGSNSVGAYGLNRNDLFEMREKHVNKNVKPIKDRLKRHLEAGNLVEAKFVFDEAMNRFQPDDYFVALSYDAFRHYVSEEELKPIQCVWPEPKDVGLLMKATPPIRRAAKPPSSIL